MDEEKGVRRQKRGLRFLGSSSPRNEYESLAVVEPEPDDELSDAEEDNPNNPNESDRVDDEYGDGDEEEEEEDGVGDGNGNEKAGFLTSQPKQKGKKTLTRSSKKAVKATATTMKLPPGTSLSAQIADDNNNNNCRCPPSMLYLYKTLLPDEGLSVRGYPLIEDSGFATKLLKFILWTFVSVAVVHVIVAHLFDDRDKVLKLRHIWVYEADLIVRDLVVFFVVGRMWQKPGIDHAAWMGTAVLSNVYFESQNFVWFLQHSVTLFQMHCLWPWELWVFALVLIVSAALLVAAHAFKAWRERILGIKLTEMALTVLLFVAPMITSNFFHLHHWYAGWLMGMHFNYNVWWSQLAMAWCWGMYVNGIAVYGRDPVLTCEYSYFLTIDNRCPYIACYLEGLADVNNTNITEMVPVDWRNCSATEGFHP